MTPALSPRAHLRPALVIVMVLAGLVVPGCAAASDRPPAVAAPSLPAPTTDVSPTVASTPDPTVAIAAPSTLGQRAATLDQLPPIDDTVPVRIRVGSELKGAAIVAVAVDPTTGDLAVPAAADTVAWYRYGAIPGQAGSAVLAAHVDWHGERGVFFALEDVPIGAIAVVTLDDGREVRFSVTSLEHIAKAELPHDRIFARDGAPQLVLITCGGAFDTRTHHYADNIVLFARLL